jgi:ClpP class serine protease
VNSPGGLPVQSQIICNKIREFAAKHSLKVHTFGGDVAASGGYFVLCSGHHVVADRTSILGNIGVIIPKY